MHRCTHSRIEQELRRLWSAALLHFVPQLNQLLRAYLTRQFALVDQIAAEHEGDHIEFTELLKSQHATHIAQYSTVCRQLRALNLHAVIEQLATTVIIAQISQRVHERCKSCYDTPLLHEGLLGWFDKAVSAWLDLTLQGDLDAQTGNCVVFICTTPPSSPTLQTFRLLANDAHCPHSTNNLQI